jgi:hypothetical protein
MTKKEIQRHIMSLTVEQIDEIVERLRSRFHGEWTNFSQLRLLCLERYREELAKKYRAED